MYIDSFINDKYITLFRYSIFLNKNNSIIVDFEYDKWNSILFLRRFYKSRTSKTLFNLLFKLSKQHKIVLLTNQVKKKFKRNYLIFCKNLRKVHCKLKYKIMLKKGCVQLIKSKIKAIRKLIKLNYKKIFKFKSYNLVNVNVNLRQFSTKSKKKMFKFILNKIVKNQARANALLLDQFLNLNLHALFFKRFKFHFFKDLEKKIFNNFNFNNFNLYFISKMYTKIVNIGYYYLFLSKEKINNIFYYLLYKNLRKNFYNIFNYKYFNQFKNYLVNIKYINYTKISFKIKAFGKMNKKNKKRIIKNYRKYKKSNFLLFFNLAFLKLVIFLLLNWFNKIIILINSKIKDIIIYKWFKSIHFFYKIYNWRRKFRHYYVSYNNINNFIFLNYKNSLLNYF
jgi:hypothetical protein